MIIEESRNGISGPLRRTCGNASELRKGSGPLTSVDAGYVIEAWRRTWLYMAWTMAWTMAWAWLGHGLLMACTSAALPSATAPTGTHCNPQATPVGLNLPQERH